MKLSAKTIAWSSVVGTGVILTDEKDMVVGQLSLHNVKTGANVTHEDIRRISLELANKVTAIINKGK